MRRKKKSDKAREKREHDGGFSAKHIRLSEEQRRKDAPTPAPHRGAAKKKGGG